MSKVPLNLEVSREIVEELDALAASEGTSKGEIIRQALSVMKVFSQQVKKGRTHIGFVADPSKLDAELTGILSVSSMSIRNAGTH